MNNNYTFKVGVDWLTATFQYSEFQEYHELPRNSSDARSIASQLLYRLIGFHDLILENAGHGRFYEYKFTDKTSVVSVYVSNRESQGIMVEFPGKWFVDSYVPVQTILANILAMGGKTTRVDVAVDLFHSDATVDGIFDELLEMRGEGWLRKTQYIHSRTGSTLGLGSRQSQFYLRLYDKGSQQGTDFAWVRCELECKSDAAHKIPHDVTVLYRQAAARMLVMLEGCDNTLMTVLSRAADGLTPLGGKTRVDKTDTVRWFETSVIPALKKMRDRDEENFLLVMNQILELIP